MTFQEPVWEYIDQKGSVEGDGITDAVEEVGERLKTLFSGKLRDNFPPKSRKVIEAYQNEPIISARACRKPLSDKLMTVINLVKRKNQKRGLTHDKFFHLALHLTTAKGTIIIEKRQVLNVEKERRKRTPEGDKSIDCTPVDLNGQQVTLAQIIERTLKHMGEKRFFHYESVSNNCQVFVESIIKANGFGADMGFIKQDVKSLFSDFVSKIGEKGTNLLNRINLLVYGKSLAGGELTTNFDPLTNIQIDDYYRDFGKYKGTQMMDTLPKTLPPDSAVIINMSDSTHPTGTHWVACVHNKPTNKISFFDSFGMPPPSRVERLMKASEKAHGCKGIFNTSTMQKIQSTNCGYFCLFYIDKLLKEKADEYDAIYTLSQSPSVKNEKMVTSGYDL